MNNYEKPNRIDDLEKKLYSPNQDFIRKERRSLNIKEYDVAQNWETPNLDVQQTNLVDEEKKPNWFFRFFIIALIFFIGTGAYLSVKWFLNSGPQVSEVDILINAPLSIAGGEQFDFEVTMQNKNQVAMRYVNVEIQFPDGTRSSTDISQEYKKNLEQIEVLEVGEIVKKNYNALLFGEENEKKEITVFLTYQADETTQFFKKEKKFDVVITSTPIRLSISNVKEITSEQELEFTIEIVSNSTQTLKNVLIQAQFPFGFNYTSATLAPREDKRTWIIPTLAPKESLTFKVKGDITGQNRDDKFFNFLVGLESEETGGAQVVFTRKDTIVKLTRPFLELDFAIEKNNSDIIILNPGKNSQASISLRNNTESQLRNASVQLKFGGTGLVEQSVTVTEGFYQSLTDLITWDETTANALKSLTVGSFKTLNFNFSGLDIDSGQIIVNPETTITVSVEANRNPESEVSEIIENSIVKKIRFNTEVKIDSKSTYYSSVFTNSGPIPPKAEQSTKYTASVILKNTSNALSNSVVTMRIPNYVKYEGLFSPNTENVSYDSVTRTVRWDVGTVPAKTGYAGNQSRELALQVSIIPSISQVGSSPVLIENILLNGTDSFTGTEFNVPASSITTAIADAKDYYSSQVSR
jgi:hypothetical protein